MPAAGTTTVSKNDIIAYAIRMAAHYNIPASIVLGVIQHESSFQPNVTSSVGAIGLMQLMPATARSLGVDPHDWRQNIEGGVKYLAQLHRGGFNWTDTLAAYGWGPGNHDDPHAQAAAHDVLGMAKAYKQYDTAAITHRLPIDSAALAIQIARKQMGDPYVWGAEGPDRFDCSGLMAYAFQQAGVNIPRFTAAGYQQYTQSISRDALRPGDLVYFNYGRKGAGVADHVGLYIGGGKMIDTRSPSEPVAIRAVDWSSFIGAGRVPGLDYSTNKQVQTALHSSVGSALPAAMGGQQVSRQELSAILKGFGLNPNMFDALIQQSVRENWSQAELLAAVYGSQAFHDAFPGIFNADGSLKMSASEWTQLAFGEGGYQDIARNAGVKVGRDGIGQLIGGNVSPDEWAFRAKILHQARSSEVYRQQFNAVLKASGQEQLGKGDWFDYIAGRTDPRIENMYEAVALTGAKGLDVPAKGALKAAGQIGEPGQQVDLKALVGQVRQVKQFISPELHAAGITDADLAVLESGNDPKNLKGQLDQLLRSRQALVGSRLAGSGGSVAGGLYPAAREGV